MPTHQIKPLALSALPLPNGSMSETHGIEIAVECEYDAGSSKPNQHYYFFVYTITITNHSLEDVQLIAREWEVTDANGTLEHVRGMGVVGQQPVIKPGHSYCYTSGCELKTPVGMMEGYYLMHCGQEELTRVRIAPFSLKAQAINYTQYLN